MRATAGVVTGSVALAALTLAGAVASQEPPQPRPADAAGPPPARIAAEAPPPSRPADPAAGGYVAAAAGCGSCHDAADGRAFAGGLAIRTPFGMLRAPNITPDPATGIGTWTRDDFERALRLGVRKGGAPLYPAMPYNHYTKATDADIDALWSYVSALPPVANAVEVDDLPFPYDVRDAMLGWQALFFEPGRFQPDPAAGAEVNRGAYLVEALAHCSACHSPHSGLGVEEADRFLQGGPVAPWYAPDISNDEASALADYSVDSLAAYLSGGNDGANRRPVGPMAEVVFENLSRLTPEDVRAIAVYLKSRPAQPAAPAAPAFEPAAADRALGDEIYAANCASCHGASGEGLAGVAARLAGETAVAGGPPDNAIAVLLEGVPARGTWGEMPSFATVLTDAEIATVANHIRSSWGNAASVAATPEMVVAARSLVDAPAWSLASSALCPAVPYARMDAATREALAALGPEPSATALAPLVQAYDAAHPDLAPSERHLALIGAHCADIVADGGDAQAVARAQVAFVSLLASLPRP